MVIKTLESFDVKTEFNIGHMKEATVEQIISATRAELFPGQAPQFASSKPEDVLIQVTAKTEEGELAYITMSKKLGAKAKLSSYLSKYGQPALGQKVMTIVGENGKRQIMV